MLIFNNNSACEFYFIPTTVQTETLLLLLTKMSEHSDYVYDMEVVFAVEKEILYTSRKLHMFITLISVWLV